LPSISRLSIGATQLKHGFNWETKFFGYGKYYRSIHKSQVGKLLEVNASMERDGFESISLAELQEGTVPTSV
jgi:hypothetical protein